jgi:hypothetical protein
MRPVGDHPHRRGLSLRLRFGYGQIAPASRLTKGSVKERTTVTHAVRSNIQAGISSHRPASDPSKAQRKTATISLVDRRMNEDVALEPRMKPIQKLPTNGPMGVRETPLYNEQRPHQGRWCFGKTADADLP